MLNITERKKISFESVSKRFGIGKNTVFVWSNNLRIETIRISILCLPLSDKR
ncbi:transposase [Orientia tsutsugamushi str. Gilliam]|uniref:Transposase n=1 Tax=Orientia tsutsugamushi str. Gilliam TaxID=1359184 RepID=A0A2U3R765_ORITS|nr:transposase [Orientia tsutsugamushi str. Gilliam]